MGQVARPRQCEAARVDALTDWRYPGARAILPPQSSLAERDLVTEAEPPNRHQANRRPHRLRAVPTYATHLARGASGMMSATNPGFSCALRPPGIVRCQRKPDH